MMIVVKPFNLDLEIVVEHEEYEHLCLPWKKMPIVKHLRKNLGLGLVSTRLHGLWVRNSEIKIMDLNEVPVATEIEIFLQAIKYLIQENYRLGLDT
ncbi:hypothetical protein RJT34_17659 [Clitoria ternatea]|uniref:Uncharacterized protein n=1 Tax=Clitoria ternatea TaxID=43366 RepID=A0AAN9JBJ8_CLITE